MTRPRHSAHPPIYYTVRGIVRRLVLVAIAAIGLLACSLDSPILH